jgi:hypothetical protein
MSLSDHTALPYPGGNYMDVGGESTRLQDEIATLREFIEDVRLGIRDLDEYEAICGQVYR